LRCLGASCGATAPQTTFRTSSEIMSENLPVWEQVSGGFLKAVCGVLGAFRGDLERSWDCLGLSWAGLGRSWENLGGLLGRLGSVLEQFKTALVRTVLNQTFLGRVLGRS